MIKLILTDLDHTLLREDGSVSPRTLRTLDACRAKGILFSVATARYWIGAEKYIDLLRPDLEITTDGTLVHLHGECVYSRSLTAGETDGIIADILAAVPGAEITAAVGKTVYWNSPRISESEKLHKAVYRDYSSPLGLCANKIVAELPDESIARRVAEKAGCRLQCYRGEKWYAFLPAGSGKTAAITALSQASGVALEDMAAFGDQFNDESMLSAVGHPYIMAHAPAELLKKGFTPCRSVMETLKEILSQTEE